MLSTMTPVLCPACPEHRIRRVKGSLSKDISEELFFGFNY